MRDVRMQSISMFRCLSLSSSILQMSATDVDALVTVGAAQYDEAMNVRHPHRIVIFSVLEESDTAYIPSPRLNFHEKCRM